MPSYSEASTEGFGIDSKPCESSHTWQPLHRVRQKQGLLCSAASHNSTQPPRSYSPAPKDWMLPLRSPSTSSAAAAPASDQAVPHVTFSISSAAPVGVMAAVPLPSSRSLGGVRSTGGVNVALGAALVLLLLRGAPAAPMDARRALQSPLMLQTEMSWHQRSGCGHLWGKHMAW